TTTVLTQLTHDLATPLGVIMGMTYLLLSEDNGLSADGRSCLEDVSREALRASEMLKRSSSVEPHTRPQPASPTPVASLNRASVSGAGTRMVLIADDDAATRRLVS